MRHDLAEHRRDFFFRRRRRRMKNHRLLFLAVHSVKDQRMQMNIQIGGAAETLNQRHRSAFGFARGARRRHIGWRRHRSCQAAFTHRHGAPELRAIPAHDSLGQSHHRPGESGVLWLSWNAFNELEINTAMENLTVAFYNETSW